ncbi:MAG: acyltransferase [Bacteroidota bacterium]
MDLIKIKYPSLNGLRAISIVMVITHHLCLLEHVLNDYYQYKWLVPFIEFIQDGHLGVNVFFVISGFLITSLMMREEEQEGKISLKNFYMRRTLRIFPAYYFMLLVYFVLQLAGVISLSGASWLSSITYTKYFNWSLDWYTAHAWSLSIEEQFYILWPLVFIFGKTSRKIIALALFIVVPILRVIVNYYPTDWLNEMTLFMRIDAIATGCLFAIYKDRIIKTMRPYWRMIFYLSVLCLFFLRYLPEQATKINLEFIFIPLGVTAGTLANVLVAVIMMYSVFGPPGIWSGFLNLEPVAYVGLLSYSLYLWQQAFMNVSGHWMTRFPQNVFFMFAAALFSYYLVEKPFLRLKAKFQKEKE